MNADKRYIEINGYTVTTDTSFLDERFGITQKIKNLLQDYYPKAHKGSPNTIRKLKHLCRKYPSIPQFKNLLSTAYGAAGKKQKAYNVNRWMLREHPDYLYGKINLAKEYLFEGEPEKVPEVMGKYVELNKLYPEREVFHSTEVLMFNQVAVQYYLKIDDVRRAKTHLNLMEELDYDHQETELARKLYLKYCILKTAERNQRNLEKW
jgi:hypothetical protein